MRFMCPFCSFLIKPDDRARGYSMKCPSCAKTILVPITPYENGCVVGDFEIENKLGRGSIGTVYKANQISLRRVVALKILSQQYTNSKGISDFLKEARAAARLSHQNLVQALAVGEEDGVCYMAMTYLSGETVKAKIEREKSIPVDEALHIIQQVAEALYYAWDEAKLIHRDVKPDNIMISDGGIVKLTDLGLAMNQKDWSEDMEISGSPSYMSPEQFAGEKLDSRSDIYSLGVTLYQMVSGQLPFKGESLKEVAKQHFSEEATPLNKLVPGVPAKVADMVRKMMAKTPDERYPSMEELLHAIWTIRQKTAPNKDLVPDVHTISINRLDYYLQNTPDKKLDATTKIMLNKVSFTSFQKLLAVSMPILLIIFIALAAIVYNKKFKGSEMRSKVEKFKEQVEKGREPADVLIRNGRELLAQFKDKRSQEDEALHNLLLYHLAKLENARLMSEMSQSKNERENIKKELSDLKSELTKASAKPDPAHKPATAPAPAAPAAAQEAAIKSENVKLKTTVDSLANENKKIKADWEEEWKSDINVRIYSLVCKGSLKEAEAVIKMESERKKGYEKWFAEKMDFVKALDNFSEAMLQSGSKCAGFNIDGYGKAVKVDGDELHYQTATGKVRMTRLFDLPPESLFVIAKELFPDKKDELLRAYLGFLTANIGHTLKQAPLEKAAEEICSSVIAQTLESIRYIATFDKKRAVAKAKSLKKQLEGTNELKKIKGELKNILQSDAPFEE